MRNMLGPFARRLSRGSACHLRQKALHPPEPGILWAEPGSPGPAHADVLVGPLWWRCRWGIAGFEGGLPLCAHEQAISGVRNIGPRP